MVHAHVSASCVHVHARIFTKIFLVVSNYFMNLSLKFRKDPCFRWGDIQLLVTMYIWYYTLNYSQFLTKNFDFFGTPSLKCFYIFSARYLSLKERKRIRAFLWKNEPRRTSALHMIWWHSANRDVLPGRFQPYVLGVGVCCCLSCRRPRVRVRDLQWK